MPNHSKPHKKYPGFQGINHPGFSRDGNGRHFGPQNTDLDPPTGDLYIRKRSVKFKNAKPVNYRELPAFKTKGNLALRQKRPDWQRLAAVPSMFNTPIQPRYRSAERDYKLSTSLEKDEARGQNWPARADFRPTKSKFHSSNLINRSGLFWQSGLRALSQASESTTDQNKPTFTFPKTRKGSGREKCFDYP